MGDIAPNTFEWDVFISHSSKNKPIVRSIAERLRDRGLNVWFDEENIAPGDHIYGKVENGLQRSRVLIFFASEASLKSDWVNLERWTASFRDPTNKHRRFITVRLDDTPLPDVLASFHYIDWNADKAPDHAFERLLNACLLVRKPPSGPLNYQQLFTPGAPPSVPDLLVGREVALAELADFLRSPGIHPVVVGERGIGKTSLVSAAIQRSNCTRTSRMEVNTVESFDDCCKQVCDDLGLPYGDTPFTPASFLRTLKQSSAFAIVSIDELDDLPANSPVVIALAKLAKAASNHANELQVKFIFSGIGADAHDIFKGHLSSERHLPQVRIEEIEAAHLSQFFDRASALLHIDIPRHIKDTIVTEADGFPYYLHQVGFHMLAAFSQDTLATRLSDVHLIEGRKRALNAAFAHYLRRYKFTIYALSELERATLESFLRTERRRLLVDELQEQSITLSGGTYDGVRDAMRSLFKKDYLVHRKADNTIALKDALLKPFLKERLGVRHAKTLVRRQPRSSDDQMNLL